MAKVADLPFKYRAMMALYPWRRIDPVPASPLKIPLAQARIAVVTTGGLVTELRVDAQEPGSEAIGIADRQRCTGPASERDRVVAPNGLDAQS